MTGGLETRSGSEGAGLWRENSEVLMTAQPRHLHQLAAMLVIE